MKRPLQVTLHVKSPSVVELTLGDKVQLDRVVPSAHGHLAERHGPLLGTGVATVALAPGFYAFRTLSDAHLRVVQGGVETATQSGVKDPTPPPVGSPPPPEPGSRGDAQPGETPCLTVES